MSTYFNKKMDIYLCRKTISYNNMNEVKIYEDGLEEYSMTQVLFSNFVMALWIVLGSIACWFLHPIAMLFYLAFAVVMIYFVLRKLVCTNCYYYGKLCSIGWGKLSATLFKKGDIERFSISIGIKIAPAVYGLLSLIPVVAITISIIMKFDFIKIGVLLLLLLISSYSGAISRKKACMSCKMRLICPGSAVK